MSIKYVGLAGPLRTMPAASTKREYFTGMSRAMLGVIPVLPCCVSRKITTPEPAVMAPALLLQAGLSAIGYEMDIKTISSGRDFPFHTPLPENIRELTELMPKCFFSTICDASINEQDVKERGVHAWLDIMGDPDPSLWLFFKLNRFRTSRSDFLISAVKLPNIRIVDIVEE